MKTTTYGFAALVALALAGAAHGGGGRGGSRRRWRSRRLPLRPRPRRRRLRWLRRWMPARRRSGTRSTCRSPRHRRRRRLTWAALAALFGARRCCRCSSCRISAPLRRYGRQPRPSACARLGVAHQPGRRAPHRRAPGRRGGHQRRQRTALHAPGAAARGGRSAPGRRAVCEVVPQLQQAYEDIGYPNRYFNDRLVDVIDQLLATRR